MSQESFRSYSCSVKPILVLQWVPVFCVAKADESETTLDVFNQSPDFRWSFSIACVVAFACFGINACLVLRIRYLAGRADDPRSLRT